MLEYRATLIPIVLAAAMAVASGHMLTSTNIVATRANAQSTAPVAQWAASATGRVEPVSGEIRLSAAVPGRVTELFVAANDVVKKGDLLVRLDDDDIRSKIAAARAEASVRVREREEETATGLGIDRRKAEDALAASERSLFAARQAFDALFNSVDKKRPADADRDAAFEKVTKAEADVDAKRQELLALTERDGMPDSQRLEASLAVARAELAGYEVALERTRIRAPIDGTVLSVLAKVGEFATPSPENTLVVVGDIGSLNVRAEVEERDADKIRVGQSVVVKSDAYPDKSFTGKVTSVSKSLGAPRIAARGPRRPVDVEVIEAVVSLEGSPPLLTGMRVDVFFENEGSKSSAAAVTTGTN